MTTTGGTVLTQILARLTGQDLRRDLAQVLHQQRMILRGQTTQTRNQLRILARLTILESIVTDLDISTDDLVTAVNDLLTEFDPATNAALLQQLAEKNQQIADLQADDDADAAQISSLAPLSCSTYAISSPFSSAWTGTTIAPSERMA